MTASRTHVRIDERRYLYGHEASVVPGVRPPVVNTEVGACEQPMITSVEDLPEEMRWRTVAR